MTGPMYFQWQNDVLVKSIYPMREPKLRDFLVYYAEVDLWAEYKNKDIAADVPAYIQAWKNAAVTAYKTYSAMRDYFMRADVRADYFKFKPIDETELTQINSLHNTFITSWPKDIRGERDFVAMETSFWEQHRQSIVDWIKARKLRLNAMAPDHEKRPAETLELQQKESVTLPMANQELDQLHAFAATYDKIEKRKLDWYRLKQKDPNFNIPEADFLLQYPADQPPTVYDIVSWKIADYKASLEKMDQFGLLAEIYQRFQKEPQRYPLWLQYMIVHFSGMRYASAHSSWADPKDLLIRLRSAKALDDLTKADNAAIAKLCADKIAVYTSAAGTPKPALAQAQEKEWKDKVALNLSNMKSPAPSVQKYGLTSMQTDEITYEIKLMTTQQVLDILLSMKDTFPAWAWKEIVKLTPLRVTQVTDPGWETLTPDEETQKNTNSWSGIGKIVVDWENYDPSAWREEHGRTHQLIVSRAVCNESAEHIQHLRGYLPPGGLTPKAPWYMKNETDNTIPGNPRPSFVKPASPQDFNPGASILWLRFFDKMPNQWDIAKTLVTKNKVGLLPAEFINRKQAGTNWIYKQGEVVTRLRTTLDANKKPVHQQQWLGWIHEATVVEVADTADGTVMLTFETALPDDYHGTASIGMFKKPMNYFLSDGAEDTYNRSFVGFVPEGQVPVNDLKEMLDWNKILRK